MELIKVQETQTVSHLSMEQMSGDEVEYISETENIEKHPDTIAMTENLKMLQNSIFKKKSAQL